MDFIVAAFVALFIGAALLVGLVSLIIHPRVNQLISGDWLPEPEGAVEVFEAPPARTHAPVGERAIQPVN